MPQVITLKCSKCDKKAYGRFPYDTKKPVKVGDTLAEFKCPICKKPLTVDTVE